MSKPQKFWMEDPCALYSHPSILPTTDMSCDQKLNALTRLAVLVAVAMYAMNFKQWLTFLALALLLIVILKYGRKREKVSRESFTVTPTYTSTDFHQTTVAPTYAEEWQIPPPAYDLYSQVPPPSVSPNQKIEELPPQSYPYGQYLTKTNLLPSDEYHTHQLNGGARQARDYMNSAFMRHDLAHRDNMTRIFKKKLARRFRHNCNDTFSPYHSY